MPSEDSKAVKLKEEKAEADEKSLSSILQARKKNPTNAGTLTTKSRPKDSKVKKEEPQVDDNDDDFDKSVVVKSSSGSRPKTSKVKKEEDDDDDHKPISKKNSPPKVLYFSYHFLVIFCFLLCF